MSLTGHEEDPTIRRVLSEASEQNHKDPTKHNMPLKPQSRIMRIKNQTCIMSLKPQSRIMRIKIRHGIISPSLAHSRGSDTASWCGGVFDERIMERPHHGIHVAESLGAESRGHIRHGNSSRYTDVHPKSMCATWIRHTRVMTEMLSDEQNQRNNIDQHLLRSVGMFSEYMQMRTTRQHNDATHAIM